MAVLRKKSYGSIWGSALENNVCTQIQEHIVLADFPITDSIESYNYKIKDIGKKWKSSWDPISSAFPHIICI